MPNFESFFRTGMDAAREVEYKRGEIGRVLKEFGAALEGETDGKLTVVRGRTTNLASQFVSALRPSSSAEMNGLFVITTGEPKKSEQIAGWRQSPDGYPCWLIVNGKEVACMDRTGLEQELGRLAASPQMGAAVLRLLTV